MKKRLITSLAALVWLASACTVETPIPTTTPFPTPVIPVTLQHFENELVVFDYPSGVRLFGANDPTFLTIPSESRMGGELVVGLAHPSWISEYGSIESSIAVFRHVLPSGSNRDEVMQTAYTEEYADKPIPEEVPEQSGFITIDGVPANRRTYRVASGPFWYTLQDIWLEKDGSLLRLSLWNRVYHDNFQEVAEVFLGSLEILENLPAFTQQPSPTPAPTPTPYPSSMLNYYEDEVLSFDYPQGMTILTTDVSPSACFPAIPFGGERLFGLGDPRFLAFGDYYRSIQITRLEKKSGSNLESVVLDVYEQAKDRFPDLTILDSTGPVSIAGQTGMQWDYRVTSGEPSYELRDIWLERGNLYYIVSIWTEYTNPEDLAVFQSGGQALVDSLKIKE